jgi:hypothetical protein
MDYSAGGILGGLNDIFDFAERSTQESNRRLATQDFDFVEAYNHGWACIVVPVLAKLSACKYDLIFHAVPHGVDRFQSGRVAPMADDNIGAGDADSSKSGMGRLTEFVQGPQGPIPSLVWLEPSKQRRDLMGEIATPSLDSCFQPLGGVCDREIGVLWLSRPARGDDTPHEIDYVKLVDSIRIRLDTKTVWLVKEEPFDSSVEIADVLLCANDPARNIKTETTYHYGPRWSWNQQRPEAMSESTFVYYTSDGKRHEAPVTYFEVPPGVTLGPPHTWLSDRNGGSELVSSGPGEPAVHLVQALRQTE